MTASPPNHHHLFLYIFDGDFNGTQNNLCTVYDLYSRFDVREVMSRCQYRLAFALFDQLAVSSATRSEWCCVDEAL